MRFLSVITLAAICMLVIFGCEARGLIEHPASEAHILLSTKLGERVAFARSFHDPSVVFLGVSTFHNAPVYEPSRFSTTIHRYNVADRTLLTELTFPGRRVVDVAECNMARAFAVSGDRVFWEAVGNSGYSGSAFVNCDCIAFMPSSETMVIGTSTSDVPIDSNEFSLQAIKLSSGMLLHERELDTRLFAIRTTLREDRVLIGSPNELALCEPRLLASTAAIKVAVVESGRDATFIDCLFLDNDDRIVAATTHGFGLLDAKTLQVECWLPTARDIVAIAIERGTGTLLVLDRDPIRRDEVDGQHNTSMEVSRFGYTHDVLVDSRGLAKVHCRRAWFANHGRLLFFARSNEVGGDDISVQTISE